MSSSSNPLCELNLAPADHHAHTIAHPMVVILASNPPFTLLKNPGTNNYQLSFRNQTSAAARVFAMGFTTSSSSPLWSTGSLTLAAASPQGVIYQLPFSVADLNGSTNLWLGAWWDDGTYGTGTPAEIASYFSDHPDTTGHHTIPVLVG
jgi:hypothetical protein